MKIKSTSWHYRLLKNVMKVEIPTTNCGYVFSVIVSLICLTLMAFLIYATTFLVGMCLLLLKFNIDISAPLGYFVYPLTGLIFIPLAFACLFAVLFVIGYSLIFLITKYIEWNKTTENKFILKYRATKQKICKEIEITKD